MHWVFYLKKKNINPKTRKIMTNNEWLLLLCCTIVNRYFFDVRLTKYIIYNVLYTV